MPKTLQVSTSLFPLSDPCDQGRSSLRTRRPFGSAEPLRRSGLTWLRQALLNLPWSADVIGTMGTPYAHRTGQSPWRIRQDL